MNLPFLVGSHSVKVWAETRVEAANARAVAERILDSMLTLSDLYEVTDAFAVRCSTDRVLGEVFELRRAGTELFCVRLLEGLGRDPRREAGRRVEITWVGWLDAGSGYSNGFVQRMSRKKAQQEKRFCFNESQKKGW